MSRISSVLLLFGFYLFWAVGCQNYKASDFNKDHINEIIDNWHNLAASADFGFFDVISDSGIYIGTATEEVWTKDEFIKFAKPYFDRGKAWNFEPYDRNVYFSEQGNIAWFNERLNTWMGICRGSGVLQYVNGEWKIMQYNLSVSVPNEQINEVIKIIQFDKK